MPDKQFLPQVLLIENDIPTIELYQRELAQSYQIVPCHDEGSVLNHLQANDIDAIILEPAFLGIDGWNLLTKIKEVTLSTPVPIVVCTTQDAGLRAKELGAAKCLVKPVLPITLRHVIDKLLEESVENNRVVSKSDL
jgi:DNA-binding response OmpR family regulator